MGSTRPSWTLPSQTKASSTGIARGCMTFFSLDGLRKRSTRSCLIKERSFYIPLQLYEFIGRGDARPLHLDPEFLFDSTWTAAEQNYPISQCYGFLYVVGYEKNCLA